MNKPNEDSQPKTEPIHRNDRCQGDMAIGIPDKETSKHRDSIKSRFRKLAFLCLVVLLSFSTSVLTTKYISVPMALEPSVGKPDCKSCGELVLDRQVQERQTAIRRIGAQMSINQNLLKENPPKLVWSHDGSDDYLDGIKHVSYYYRDHSYDCLEIHRSGRYLVTVQLTYHYTGTYPSTAVNSYFTLTRFRNSTAHLIAKSEYVVPSPGHRSSNTVRQPASIVRSDPLNRGDRLCVTVSHPDLIYASKIDSFFGIVYL